MEQIKSEMETGNTLKHFMGGGGGVPILRNIILYDKYWGRPILGNLHIVMQTTRHDRNMFGNVVDYRCLCPFLRCASASDPINPKPETLDPKP